MSTPVNTAFTRIWQRISDYYSRKRGHEPASEHVRATAHAMAEELVALEERIEKRIEERIESLRFDLTSTEQGDD